MVGTRYVPDVGHVVWLSLNPQSGREQAGRRPFLVLTPHAYNEKTSLLVGCPITKKLKGYPFEVLLPTSEAMTGVVLADHVKSVDWRARFAEFAGQVPPTTLGAVRGLLAKLLQI